MGIFFIRELCLVYLCVLLFLIVVARISQLTGLELGFSAYPNVMLYMMVLCDSMRVSHSVDGL